MTQHCSNELLCCNFSILVLVHLCKSRLSNEVFSSNVRIISFQKTIHVLDQPCQFLLSNCPITVHIKHSKYLAKDLLRCSVRHDVENNHELYKVYVAIIVSVIHSKHMFLHLTGILLWQGLRHHFSEIFWLHPTIGMFSYEAIESILDLISLK